jgi:anti-sigma factor RsiW
MAELSEDARTSELCSRLQQELSSADAGSPADPVLTRHLEGCEECRQQWSAEQALRDAFAGMARPALSLHFKQELNLVLAEERRRQRRLWWRLRLMRAYWLVAAMACVFILVRLPWSAISQPGAWLTALALVAVSAVLPVLLVLRTCRVDLLDLILGTCDDLSPFSLTGPHTD